MLHFVLFYLGYIVRCFKTKVLYLQMFKKMGFYITGIRSAGSLYIFIDHLNINLNINSDATEKVNITQLNCSISLTWRNIVPVYYKFSKKSP